MPVAEAGTAELDWADTEWWNARQAHTSCFCCMWADTSQVLPLAHDSLGMTQRVLSIRIGYPWTSQLQQTWFKVRCKNPVSSQALLFNQVLKLLDSVCLSAQPQAATALLQPQRCSHSCCTTAVTRQNKLLEGKCRSRQEEATGKNTNAV